MNALCFPLNWEIILVLNWRKLTPPEEMWLQITIWRAFHQCKALVPTTFVNWEYEDDMSVILIGISELLCRAICSRPAVVLLWHFNAFRILTFHYKELSSFQVNWGGVNDFFPLGLFCFIKAWLVLSVILSMVKMTLVTLTRMSRVIVLSTWMVRSWMIRSYRARFG